MDAASVLGVARDAGLRAMNIWGMHVRYDHGGGASAPVTALSSERGGGSGRQDRRCTLAMIQDEGLGQTGAPAYVVVRSVVPCFQMVPCLLCHWRSIQVGQQRSQLLAARMRLLHGALTARLCTVRRWRVSSTS